MLKVSARFSRSVAETIAGADVGATPRTFTTTEVGCTVGGAGVTVTDIGEELVVLCPSLTATVAV